MSKFKTFLTQTLAIWRVELLRLRRSLIWSGFFFVFLTALSVYNGASFYRHQQENVKELTQQSTTWTQEQAQKTQRREQQLKEDNKALQPDKKIYRNPAYLANTGPYVSAPPADLAVLSVGQSPLLPQSYRVTLLSALLWQPVYNLFHPLQLWLGYFDFVFVLSYLFPLWIILLGLDLLADERLNGNLALYATYQWSWQKLLFVKLVLRVGLSACLLLILGLEAYLLTGYLSVPMPTTGLISGLLFSWGHALFWLGLVSCFHRWQRYPAVISLGLTSFWLCWAWVVPALAGQWASHLHPVPSRFDYLQRYRETEETVRKQQDRETASYLQDHPEMQGGTDNTYAIKQLAKAERLAKALDPLVLEYQQQLDAQLKWVEGVRFFSPVYASQWSLQRLSGSDRERYHTYLKQIHAFQHKWNGFFGPKIKQGQALSSADFTQFPAFEFVESPLKTRLRQAVLPNLFWSFLGFLLMTISLIWPQNRPEKAERAEQSASPAPPYISDSRCLDAKQNRNHQQGDHQHQDLQG